MGEKSIADSALAVCPTHLSEFSLKVVIISHYRSLTKLSNLDMGGTMWCAEQLSLMNTRVALYYITSSRPAS